MEIQPRVLQMAGVALQLVAAEIGGEELLAERDCRRRVGAIKSMRLPGLFACLDDDGGHVAAELIGMNLEPAVLGLLERKGKGRELLRRTKPHEAALPDVDM